eukprot:1607372-Alexandrium_andersonii.AAC.1
MSRWSSEPGSSVNGCSGCVSHAVACALACIFNMTLGLPFSSICCARRRGEAAPLLQRSVWNTSVVDATVSSP